MQLKAGVKVAGVQPEILIALQTMDRLFIENNCGELVVTSLSDGIHKPNSLHNRMGVCLAADVRTRHLTDYKQKELLALVKAALGDEYDVILEGDHMHVEFDP